MGYSLSCFFRQLLCWQKLRWLWYLLSTVNLIGLRNAWQVSKARVRDCLQVFPEMSGSRGVWIQWLITEVTIWWHYQDGMETWEVDVTEGSELAVNNLGDHTLSWLFPLWLFLCFLATMRWAVFLYHTLLPWCLYLAKGLKAMELNHNGLKHLTLAKRVSGVHGLSHLDWPMENGLPFSRTGPLALAAVPGRSLSPIRYMRWESLWGEEAGMERESLSPRCHAEGGRACPERQMYVLGNDTRNTGYSNICRKEELCLPSLHKDLGLILLPPKIREAIIENFRIFIDFYPFSYLSFIQNRKWYPLESRRM